MLDLLILVVAGLAAGALNAVAGGGTFISLPALIYLGIPPTTANATATLAALPGYASSSWAFRHDIRAEGSLSLGAIAVVATLGSVIGAVLLVYTPEDVFRWIVPWLLLFATVMFAAGPWLLARFRAGDAVPGQGISALAILAVSIYGGYFNGGLGIMLLAVFGLLGYTNLHGMNGLKNGLSVLLSAVAVVAFVVAGIIAWMPALVMSIAAALGGYFGGRFSRSIKNMALLRAFITLVGLGMSAAFFLS